MQSFTSIGKSGFGGVLYSAREGNQPNKTKAPEFKQNSPTNPDKGAGAKTDALLKSIISGSIGGVVADGLTHPFCTVKARTMVQGAGSSVTKYTSLPNAFKTIIKTEGPGTLYKGLGIVMVGAAPAAALFLTAMDQTQQALGDNVTGNLAAGAAAQLGGSTFWVPMEVIKEKMMIQGQLPTKQQYSGSFHLAKNVIAKEGFKGIYKGFMWQQFSYMPFNSLAVMGNKALEGMIPEESKSVATGVGCKLTAFSAAAVITNPFDVVKTRMQVQTSNPEVFNYKNGLDCAKQIAKNEGVSGFMTGSVERAAWLAPRFVIFLAVAEQVGGILNKKA